MRRWLGCVREFDNTVWLQFVISEPVGWKEMFYLMTHSTHFIYGYTASDIWLRTILIVGKETRSRHIGYSYRLTARVLLYAPSHRQNNTAFVTPVVEHWLEREIAQWVHPMKDRSDDPSHHERTLLPRTYISLPNPLDVLICVASGGRDKRVDVVRRETYTRGFSPPFGSTPALRGLRPLLWFYTVRTNLRLLIVQTYETLSNKLSCLSLCECLKYVNINEIKVNI